MSNKVHYFFYVHINKINGKVYVGETKQNPPSKRWKNGKNYKSNKHFTRSIEKFGWDNFEHIILEECDCTTQEMKEKEQYWIEYYDSRNPLKGYNIAPGGYSGLSPLALEKAKEWMLLHPEISMQRVSAMHKCEKSTFKKQLPQEKDLWNVLKLALYMKAQQKRQNLLEPLNLKLVWYV